MVPQVLEEEFSQWLDRTEWRWTTWTTLTFARPQHSGALKWSHELVEYIARTAVSVWGFSFEEHHHDGRRLHVHSLLSIQRNLWGGPSNQDIWNRWRKRHGRCLIEDIREKSTSSLGTKVTGLAHYLCKYISKSSDRCDWDFCAFSNGIELTSDQFAGITGLSQLVLPK